VLITKSNRAKLSDYCMHNTAQYLTLQPPPATPAFNSTTGTVSHRHMAPELQTTATASTTTASTTAAASSTAADAYCYGVLLYEVLSGEAWSSYSSAHSSSSYSYRRNSEQDLSGYSLQGAAPPLHSDKLRDTNVAGAAVHAAVMRECLSEHPAARPTLPSILQRIQQI
jgi:Protein tyrosine and serine/threonine kinase